MKYECPECKSNLIHIIIINRKVITELYSYDSEIKKNITCDESQSEVVVECSNNRLHDIPSDLQLKVVDLIDWMG